MVSGHLSDALDRGPHPPPTYRRRLPTSLGIASYACDRVRLTGSHQGRPPNCSAHWLHLVALHFPEVDGATVECCRNAEVEMGKNGMGSQMR
jgi:hypothetical protein